MTNLLLKLWTFILVLRQEIGTQNNNHNHSYRDRCKIIRDNTVWLILYIFVNSGEKYICLGNDNHTTNVAPCYSQQRVWKVYNKASKLINSILSRPFVYFPGVTLALYCSAVLELLSYFLKDSIYKIPRRMSHRIVFTSSQPVDNTLCDQFAI